MGEIVATTTQDSEVQDSYDLMALVGTIGEVDFYDRVKYEGNMAQEVVDVFASFEPPQRASMYSLWRATGMSDGLASLADHEILLLGFAPQDGAAEEASKLMDGPFTHQWYLNNVTFEGDEAGTAGYGGPLKRLMEADPDLGSDPEQLLRIMDLDAQSRGLREPEKIGDVGDTLQRWSEDTFGAIAAGTILLAGTAMATASGHGLMTGGAAVTTAIAGSPAVATLTPWIQKLIAGAGATKEAVVSASGRAVLGTEPGALQTTKSSFMYLQMRIGQPIQAIAQKLVPAASKVPYAGTSLASRLDQVGTYGGSRGSWRLLAAAGLLSQEAVDNLLNPDDVAAAQARDATTEDGDEDTPETTSEFSLFDRKVGATQYEVADVGWHDILEDVDNKVQVAEVRTAEATNLTRLYQVHAQGRSGVDETGEAAPQVSTEDIASVLSGTMTAGDFELGGDPEKILSEAAFSMLGGHWYDEEIDGAMEEVLSDPSLVLFEDVTSIDEYGQPRKIVLPATAVAGGATEAYAYQRDKLQLEWENAPVDPLIGVPEGYRARTYRPISDRYGGGTLMEPGDLELERTGVAGGYGAPSGRVPREMDRYEADFISRAQGTGGAYQESRTVTAHYRESDVYDQMANMSPVQIFKFQGLMRSADMYQNKEPAMPGQFSPEDADLIGEIMWVANVNGDSFWGAATEMSDAGKARKDTDDETTKTVRTKDPFSVPAHLRSIPGEKTVAEEAKIRFEQKMGRAARPDELAGIANELTGYHTTSNQEQIALYLAAYNGDNQGLLTGAQMQRIEEPGAATSFDISEKWANEIDLNKRRETNSDSFSRMLSATMGNRPSVGNMTAASGVQTIGRQ